jgi:crotonobetainyl-CoA:carnitine CoA-transferase CaiB-like acyl-CoA transferase
VIAIGPAGTGKTTLAFLVARITQCDFVPFSAVLSGIKEIKVLGREDLIEHPKFRTNPLRCDNRKDMVAILEKEMAKMKTVKMSEMELRVTRRDAEEASTPEYQALIKVRRRPKARMAMVMPRMVKKVRSL